MKYILYIIRFFWKIRFWLITIPVLIAIMVYMRTSNLKRYYEVNSSVYTGVVSGYDMGEASANQADWNTKNSTIQNVIQIIKSDYTLRNVSMRLYARCLMNGNPNYNTTYLNADTYKWIVNQTPKYVMDLIVEGDEDKTVENFFNNMRPNNRDHLYGLFLWEEGLATVFGKKVLQEVVVSRIASSDMLQLYFKGTDPGITYQTMLILIDEFQNQYHQLRFGETNDAIAYFQQELALAEINLKAAEDALTRYNIDKKVINYIDETKEIAVINKDFELLYYDILLQYASAKAYSDGLQQRVETGSQASTQNTALLAKLDKITQLQIQITQLEAFAPKTDENLMLLADLRAQLDDHEAETLALTDYINEIKYSEDGLVNSSFIERWVMERIELAKAEAQVEVMNQWKNEIDKKYAHYAPIGSTIKSREREIGFTERTYLSLLEGLNSAILRLKHLQMSTNNLKITDLPAYPINPLPHKRKMMVALGFICGLVFVIGFFFFIEFFDRTLRDTLKTEFITGKTIIGAMPGPSYRYRGYNKETQDIATHQIAKSLTPYFGSEKPIYINLLSTSQRDGKHFIAEKLTDYWLNYGLNVRIVSYRGDFNYQSKEYLMAENISDILLHDGGMVEPDVIIAIHQSLSLETVPKNLLQSADINLMVTRSNRTWKDIDQKLFNSISEESGVTPFLHLLNFTSRDLTESFTGLLPPYTTLRKYVYKFSQLGLTSKDEFFEAK